jgi:excinuclease ABC subunit B
VAIFDADKSGFLRDKRSLTQTVGRAARHVNGKAILYGDKITPAMQATIDETNRRRTIQIRYNEEHGITPTAIRKEINTTALASLYKDADAEKQRVEQTIREGWKTAEWQKMDVKALEKAIANKSKQMLAAAKAQEYEIAARLRDEWMEMKNRLQAMQG